MKRATGRVLVPGTVAGVLATAAMSMVFVAADKLRLLGRKPPRIIIDHFLPVLPRKTADRVALAAHIGYGAAGGVGFALIPSPAGGSAVARAGKGLIYGLVVWAISYEGCLPAAGVLPAAHRDRPGRACMIIAAHVVYGVSLGLLLGRRPAGRGVHAVDPPAGAQ